MTVFSALFQSELSTFLYDTIDVIRKTWIYKRKNIKGWWVGWYESGNRKAKALPSKKLAEHFSQLKYSRIATSILMYLQARYWLIGIKWFLNTGKPKKCRESPKVLFI